MLLLSALVIMMNDQYYIDMANNLLDTKAYTRASLSRELGISREKLHRLSVDIPKYPRALNAIQAASLGRKSGKIKWGYSFKLRGSPNFPAVKG